MQIKYDYILFEHNHVKSDNDYIIIHIYTVYHYISLTIRVYKHMYNINV